METIGDLNTEQGSTEWHPVETFPLSNCHNANLIWAKALQIKKRKNKTKHIILEYILSHHWTSTHPRVNMSTEVTDVSQPQQWRFNWPSWLWSTNGVKLNASQNQTHPVFNTWAVSNISHSFTLHYSLYMELGRLDYLVDSLINWNPLRHYTIQLEKIGMRLYWLKYPICTVDISLLMQLYYIAGEHQLLHHYGIHWEHWKGHRHPHLTFRQLYKVGPPK